MTLSEFWSSAGANTIGSIVGVVVGVLIALWIERTRQRREEAAVKVRQVQEARFAADRLQGRRDALLGLLAMSLEDNLKRIEPLEIEVGHDRPVYWSTLELQTWDVLKPGLLELLDDPLFVARLARYFAQLQELASMVARRTVWPPGHQGFTAIRDEILKLGPQLRHDGQIILDELRRLG